MKQRFLPHYTYSGEENTQPLVTRTEVETIAFNRITELIRHYLPPCKPNHQKSDLGHR